MNAFRSNGESHSMHRSPLVSFKVLARYGAQDRVGAELSFKADLLISVRYHIRCSSLMQLYRVFTANKGTYEAKSEGSDKVLVGDQHRVCLLFIFCLRTIPPAFRLQRSSSRQNGTGLLFISSGCVGSSYRVTGTRSVDSLICGLLERPELIHKPPPNSLAVPGGQSLHIIIPLHIDEPSSWHRLRLIEGTGRTFMVEALSMPPSRGSKAGTI